MTQPRPSRESYRRDARMPTSTGIDSQALFDAFCLARRVEAAAPKTLEHYRDSVLPLVRRMPQISDITTPAVYEYLDRLRQRVCLASYRSYLIDLKTFLRWLHEEGYLPPIKITVPDLPEVIPPTYSREQIALLLKRIKRGRWFGQRDYAILYMLWDTGARSNELCCMRRPDLNITTGRIIRLFGKGRSGKRKERLVGISQTTVRVLKAWLRVHGGLPTDYLFPSRKGARLTTSGLYQMIERRCKDAGISIPRAVHAWRHTFAVHAYERGADISDLKDDLGHTRYETVDIYRRATALARQSRHDRYSPVEGD